MKKIIKTLFIVFLILISNLAILINTVQAVENNPTHIYAKSNFNKILKYNGILIKTTHVVYSENGKEYPAYCLNVELPGVEETEYDVTNEGKLKDLGLWRVITNGYPYKSLEQLGVLNEEEAYIATKQSIYCYIKNRGTEKYSGVGESGERTLNAIKKILNNAQNSTETFENPQINIEQDEKWQIENKQKNYISKQFQITSEINISKYLIEIENQPEGIKITDLSNNEKTEFNSSEKFKILIPIENLQESGKFKIKIKSQMETKPVPYGKAPNENVQNYALTAFSYENVDKEIIQTYEKNKTKIIIEKEDEKNNKLEGAIFEILDENKNVVEITETNKQGIIELNQILPGKYYIREKEAPQGFQKNSEIIEVEIKLNEQKNIKVKNSKIQIIEKPKIEPVEEVKKLPITGM